MNLIDKVNKKKKMDVRLKYKPIQLTPGLLERQYAEECYKKYGLEKHHSFVSK